MVQEYRSPEIKKKLWHYLRQFVSENKRNLFENIILNRTRHITIALEDIYQPHNASAVLRSCDCFGVQDIHVIENDNEYNINPDVALGSSKWLTINKYNKYKENTADCIRSLKSKGYSIVATTPHENDCLLEDLPLDNKIALLFGQELRGLTKEAKGMADSYVKIPMYGFTESFNISVSAAMSIFYLTEKMRKTDIDWHLSEEEKLDIKLEWARSVIKRVDLLEQKFFSQ